MSIFIYVLSFIFTLGILITVHEWGHFIVAKKLGVKVLRFSIGFGKPIWRHIAKNGTEYCIACIPLGGYVKMLDEREGVVAPLELPLAFNQKPVWSRIAIVLAGPVANFIFAAFAFILVYSIGTRDFAPIVDSVTPGSAAEHAGIAVQDELTAVNHHPTHSQQMVRRIFLEEPHQGDYVFSLERKNKVVEVVIPASALKDTPLDELFFKEIGFTLAVPAIIGEVAEHSVAAFAGLHTGDQVIAVNQQAVHNWFEFVETINAHPGEKIDLTILRNQKQLELSLVPATKMHNGQAIGFIGVTINKSLLRLTRFPIHTAIWKGLNDTWFYSLLTFESIIKMLVGQIGLEHLSGPISIAIYAGNSVQTGLVYFLQFLAFLSISLGVINLLPIPMLDGGHLLYYALEVLRRKPLSLQAQQIGLAIGLVLLVSLMTLAFYNDVIQLSR